MINFSKIPTRKPLILCFSFTYLLWGTSWEIPIFQIPPSYVWIGLILIAALLLPRKSVASKDAILSLTLLGYFCLMSLIALPTVMAFDTGNDTSFLILYTIKLIVGVISIFVLHKVFTDFEDIHLFILVIATALVPLAILLWYKYKIQFGVQYVGVDISYPQKLGKNSFAAALNVISPFFFILLRKNALFKIASVMSILAFLLMLYGIESRSMVIISLCQLMLFVYLILNRKQFVVIASSAFVTIFLFGSIYLGSILQFTLTRTSQDDLQLPVEEIFDMFYQSHRARLARQAISGFIDNSGFGHGTATFRINGTVGLSISHKEFERTESHNDYLTLLYEQGLIGLSLFLFLVLYRLRQSIKLYRLTREPILAASILSLSGAMLAMVFANIVTALIFWLPVGLNIVICRISRKTLSDDDPPKGFLINEANK